MTGRAGKQEKERVRVILFVNNRGGLEVSRYLWRRGEKIVAVVVHPVGRARYRQEILELAEQSGANVFEADELERVEVVGRLAEMAPTIGVSAFFGYILRRPVIAACSGGILNVHPAYLPYNRGAYPNVWSIVERTPAGATIHFVDEGVDTGDIVAQSLVPVFPTDTGESLYRKLEDECIHLFSKTWPEVLTGDPPRLPQNPGSGTSHRWRDVEEIDEIQLDRSYTARELIDRIRARTFRPHDGTYFNADGRRVYLRLELYERLPDGKAE